ncbi:hypothetical protein [Flexilinea flocculi]|uniref:Transglutaminase-like superfamily n=1 Tax=Flexilinea flocculi TaxID=1678840 RepID=A0A0K8PBD7_9CHLR|nr:hypothetical protein [Flexilinea flocculi]GAP39460.1 transglutaminase-like superfamily [Flexilinea flocculi]
MKRFHLLLLFMLLICTVGVSAQSEHRTDTFSFQNDLLKDNLTDPSDSAESTQGSDIDYYFVGDIGIHYVYKDGLITSLYHLYGNVLSDLIDIYLTNRGTETVTILVETKILNYSGSVFDTVIIQPNEEVEVHQNPRLIPSSVNNLNSQQPGLLSICITQLNDGEDDVLIRKTQEILLYSRRDVVWGVDNFDYHQSMELYAAYVTPNDPAVEELIRRAADYTETGIITSGYGSSINDEDGSVLDRLQAIWRAEEEYDLIYVSTMLAFSPGTVQRMRTPYEVLQQSSGNCIELAALYASAAEALDLEAAIIFIPGHAYLAVRTDQENAMYYFIETTLIGRTDFSEALTKGEANWDEDRPYVDDGESGYDWVNIYEAREKGILPMPWR